MEWMKGGEPCSLTKIRKKRADFGEGVPFDSIDIGYISLFSGLPFSEIAFFAIWEKGTGGVEDL